MVATYNFGSVYNLSQPIFKHIQINKNNVSTIDSKMHNSGTIPLFIETGK